jgi:hypothetical protein
VRPLPSNSRLNKRHWLLKGKPGFQLSGSVGNCQRCPIGSPEALRTGKVLELDEIFTDLGFNSPAPR